MNLALRVLFILSQLLFASNLFAKDGQYLCSPVENLIGDADAILTKPGTPGLQYGSMGITRLSWGESSNQKTYFILDFDKRPPTIQAHHFWAQFKSGKRVYREQQLEHMFSARGSHSHVELYKTVSESGIWPLIHDSQKIIPDSFMPDEANSLASGKIYALVGVKAAIIGYPKRGQFKPKFAFCLKQDNRGMTESHMRAAYSLLIQEYREKIKPSLGNSSAMVFEESDYTKNLKTDEQVESVVRILDSHFKDPNNAFISDSGYLLSLGAFMTSAAMLTKFLMRRANVAAAILPPNIINEFMVMGKTVIYLPEHGEIPLTDVEDLFKEMSREEIEVVIKESPALQKYLHDMAVEILRQTQNPLEA